MKFSYNWLKEFVGFRESPEKIAEFLTLRAFEVESVEKRTEDWTLDVKIPPNRWADASGHRGLAAEIAVLKNLKVRKASEMTPGGIGLAVKEDRKYRAATHLTVEVKDAEDCPRYSARIMEHIEVESSPKWLRERLEGCGIQSVNAVVDAANYVMLETGQPLHVFDYEKLSSKKLDKKTLRVRRAKEGERIETLDGKTYDLSPETLVIADEREPIAVAGIKGGKSSGVTGETKTIILESANFSPPLIQRGSSLLRIATDASERFSHGLDAHQTLAALDRLAVLIEHLTGGLSLAGVLDEEARREKPKKILFRSDYANRIIGEVLNSSFYYNAFLRLGCSVRRKSEREFLVEPPTVRRDLGIEEDLVEEAARLFGYEAIQPRMPTGALTVPARNDELFWTERIRDALSASGFTESYLSPFAGEAELRDFGLSASSTPELENPTSPKTRFLLPRPVIQYVRSLAENLPRRGEAKIFGKATAFLRQGDKIREEKNLILAVLRKGASGEEEFYVVKGAVEEMLEGMGISDHWYREGETGAKNPKSSLFHPYRTAEVKIGDATVGILGEIHPSIAKKIKARARIAAAEIDFNALLRLAASEAEYRPIGKYPAIIRDLAVILPEEAKTESVQNIIENSAGELLLDTDLFDYFQDEGMRGSAEKSLAFHLVFQSPERTLRDEEVDSLMSKIIAAIEEKGWEVRK